MVDSFAASQAEEHAGRIFALADRYMLRHSEAAAEELKALYDQTADYCRQGCAAYDGVMALHAHVLALWNVNGHFDRSLAFAYAHQAEESYQKFLDSDAVSAMMEVDQRVYRMYLKNVRLICAYVDYCSGDLYGAQQWLQKIGVENPEVSAVALMASVLFRLTMDEGREDFLAPFELFRAMDQMFVQPLRHPFEEDILRTAYGFYELYYTHGVCDPARSVPYDPAQAVRILTRACALFADARKKEWMLDKINEAKGKC